MKTSKILLPFLLAMFVLAGCNTDDLKEDIDALTDRVTSLEAQMSLLNENLNALRVFVEGNKTVVSYTVDDNGTYTVVLSDGETLTLTQGSEGSVDTPTITINEDGNWVINGVDSGVKAIGDNGVTPQFRINSEGYWQVYYTNEWEYVLDENGNYVLATTSGTIETGDQFFASVTETTVNGISVIQVTLYSGETYSLPIVEDLLCEIVEPESGYSNGVWNIGYGLTATTEVIVKGDNYVVTAPSGWVATIEITDEDTGEGILTVTAPAQTSTLSRAAVADNSTDLTVQVNKGVTWAVDKIKVEAIEVVTSYYALYQAGETLTIGDLSISMSDYGEATLIDADNSSITTGGVYFIEPGVAATYDATDNNYQNVILIGNNSIQRSSLTVNRQIRVAAPDNDGLFLCYNIDMDASEVYNSSDAISYILTQNADGSFGDVYFYDCSVTMPTSNPITYISSSSRNIANFVIENSSIIFSEGDSNNKFIVSVSSSTATYPNITLKNSVFYCADGLVENFKIFNGNYATISQLVLQNNTFVNVGSNTTAFVYASTISDVQVSDNLFFADATNGTVLSNAYMVIRLTESATGTVCSPNIGYRGDGSSANPLWRMFYYSGGVTSGWGVSDSESITVIDSNPFDGGTFDLETGTFTPNSTYSEYGAQQ